MKQIKIIFFLKSYDCTNELLFSSPVFSEIFWISFNLGNPTKFTQHGYCELTRTCTTPTNILYVCWR